jgi:hypothetical protein
LTSGSEILVLQPVKRLDGPQQGLRGPSDLAVHRKSSRVVVMGPLNATVPLEVKKELRRRIRKTAA